MQWLNSTIEFLSSGWAGSLIGLVGIALAAIFYFRTRQRTRLVFMQTGERLLGLSDNGLPEGVTVQYRGEDIERLTRALVVFWNAGEKTILGEDLVTTDPLRLKFSDDCRVLTATVLKEVRAVSETRAILDVENPNEVRLRFSFLDPGDGAVVEVLHTSQRRYPEFIGTVRGLPEGLLNLGRLGRIRLPFPKRLYSSLRKLGWYMVFLGCLTASSISVVPFEKLEIWSDAATTFVRPAIVAAGAFYALTGLVPIFLTRRRHPKALHLDQLD